MAVADARALRPNLVLAEADPAADAAALDAIADWSRRFTPLAAPDPPDGVLLDIAGAAHLFGGEAALMAEIESRLAAQGFSARAAVAPGPALARALARFQVEQTPVDRPESALDSKNGAHATQRLIAPDAEEEEIIRIAAALPVAALGVEAETLDAIRRAGLRRVGDLMARPRAPLAARFGQKTLTRLDALLCRIRDPIAPRFEAPAFIAERRFVDGLTQRADIEATLRLLASDLCPMLERAGVGARRVEAVFYRVDGAVKRLRAGTSRPLRDPVRLAALLNERLAAIAEEGLDTGYGFDVLRLCATETERCGTEQTKLAEPSLRAAGEAAAEPADLADLLDRLGARLGLRRVLRLYPREAHLPEFAVAAVPAARAERIEIAAQQFPRPLRLFERPEPIEAIALLPDGPPLKFRWRRALHEIVAYEGPERVAPPWWSAKPFSSEAGAGSHQEDVSEQKKDAALTRDYFHAQDGEGRLFWLFREGLYARETDCPRWYVHGLS